MNKRTWGWVLLAVSVIALISLTFVISSPPDGQKEVIYSIIITDTTKGYQLTPEFVSKTSIAWLTVVPVDPVTFVEGETYSQGVWLYKNPSGDVDYVATVWGPDDTGDGFYVELARLSSHELTISYGAGTIYVPAITDWSGQVQDGYTVLKLGIVD